MGIRSMVCECRVDARQHAQTRESRYEATEGCRRWENDILQPERGDGGLSGEVQEDA